jgi:hypothetical protein
MKTHRNKHLDFDRRRPDNRPKPIRERQSVTVCVAAICKALPPNENFSMIVGAADRMLTAGDIEFEPEVPKIVPLTNSIFVLLAGDSSLQTEIMQKVYSVTTPRIQSDPTNWIKVRDAAELYANFYNKIRLREAEDVILTPLGLTIDTFAEKQRMMAPELVHEIASNLTHFQLQSSVAAIVCGVDNSGAHIYVVRGSSVECRDVVGFAAIGAGDWHSNSQFMFAKHTRSKSFSETLLLTYAAKKRAEVAPGVGSATDMFAVGPVLGHNVYPMGDHVFAKLNETYCTILSKIGDLAQEANTVIGQFVDAQTKVPPQPQTANPPALPTVPVQPSSQSPSSDETTE